MSYTIRNQQANQGLTTRAYFNSYGGKEENEEEKEKRITRTLKQSDENIVNKIIAKTNTKALLGTNAALKMAVTHPATAGIIKAAGASAPMSGGIAAAIAATQMTQTNSRANREARLRESDYSSRTYKNLYGRITPGGANVNLGMAEKINDKGTKLAKVASSAMMINELMNGSFAANGKFSGATMGMTGMANKAYGLALLNGGIGGLGANVIGAGKGALGLAGVKTGALTGLAETGTNLLAGGGTMFLASKALTGISNIIKEMDPNNTKNSKKVKFATASGVKHYKSEDSMEAGILASTNAMIKTMGPNGMGILTPYEAMDLGLSAKVSFHTSFLPGMMDFLQDLTDLNSPNKNRGNEVLNLSRTKFGVNDSTGREYDTMVRNGKVGVGTDALAGILQYTNTLSALNPSRFGELFTTEDMNSSVHDRRDAKLTGDVLRADKLTGMNFNGLSTLGVQLILQDIPSYIAGMPDKGLALAYYQAEMLRLLTTQTIENFKYQKTGSSETIGGMKDRLDREQEEARVNSREFSFIRDVVLRGFDDALRKTPVLKVFSTLGHALVPVVKGLNGINNFFSDNPVDSVNRLKGYFGQIYNEGKEAFIHNRMDPRAKNEKQLREATDTVEVSLEEQFYSYMVKVFPNEFGKLLQAVGVKNAQNLSADRFSGDWVTNDELAERNQRRAESIKDVLNSEIPDQNSFMQWMGNKVGRKFYGIKDMEEAMRENASTNFAYVKNMRDGITGNLENGYDQADIDNIIQQQQDPRKSEAIQMMINPLEDIKENTGRLDKTLTDMLRLTQLQTEILNVKLSGLNSINPDGRMGSSVQDIIENRLRIARDTVMFKTTTEQLPYLEKIYNLLEGKFNPITVKKKEEIKNDDSEPLDLLGGIGSFFGLGGDKNKNKPTKTRKSKFKGGALGKMAKGFMTGATALMAIPGVGWVGAALLGTLGTLAYVFSDEIGEFLSKVPDFFMDLTDSVFKTFTSWGKSIKEFFFGKSDEQKEIDRAKGILDEHKQNEKDEQTVLRINKNKSITDQINTLGFSQNTTSPDTKHRREFEQFKLKEIADKLNADSYKNYGIDINSYDLNNNKGLLKNLNANALLKLMQDRGRLNSAEPSVNKEEETIRAEMSKFLSKTYHEAYMEELNVSKMSGKEQAAYKELHPKFDSLLTQLTLLGKTIDPSKTNTELYAGIAEIVKATSQSNESTLATLETVANSASVTAHKLLDNNNDGLEFILNNKISNLIPGLSWNKN